MAKQGALLFLLAVAASQVRQVYLFSQEVDISTCPITFYGRSFSVMNASLTGSSALICFKHNSSETSQDCVTVRDQLNANRLTVEVSEYKYSPGSPFHAALPNIKSTSDCSVIVGLAQDTQPVFMAILFTNFGTQLALGVVINSDYTSATVNVTATVNDSTLGSRTFSTTQGQRFFVMDLSGCRLSDAPFVVASNFERILQDTCTKETCEASAALSAVSTCGPMEICEGNNKCRLLPAVCTVTASTVIGFLSGVHAVSDRCVYSLMSPQGDSSFDLLAGFRERRRQDVSFLDHLILWLRGPGVKIYLEQGGRVRVDEQVLTLSSMAQQVHGVELSKDQTGVTANIPFANATVFFDGNTAHVSGHVADVDGLCGSPNNSSQTTLIAARSSSYSAAGCEIQYNDTADTTINCNSTTELCNLMRQADFAVCHSHVDPEPYITACTSTLCKYPAVDGLSFCQFLEAYAKSCSLKMNATQDGWKSAANCPAVSQAFCQDRYCSAHEFCGEKYGENRCLCRAIFASKYKATNSLGEPTVCTQSSATLTLAGCLLEDKGIDYSVLHLNDQNCTGHIDNRTHMVTFSYDSSNTCGSEVVMNNSQVIYKNAVMMRNISANSIITYYDQVQIDFSCYYNEPDVKSVAFKIKDGSVVQQIVSGVWNYTLMMNTYDDSALNHLVGSDTEIQLNQKIWVELKTEGLDANMVSVVTDSCWATNVPSPDASLRYDLIVKGCPNSADQTVNVNGNGVGTSNFFSFNMFVFAGKTSEIYLHCKLELCLKQSNTCAPQCSGGGVRKRRSFRSTDANPALITMAWSN